MTCLGPSGKGPSSPACSLDTAALQLWGLRGARLVLTGFGCGLGNLVGAGAEILPNPTGIHSALPCAGAKDHPQGLSSRVLPASLVWPSWAPWPVQGGSLQGGFQQTGKQRPDGTQIPAQSHPPSWVCTAPMCVCSREGFSLCWTSAAVPGRHPSSPARLPGTVLARCPIWGTAVASGVGRLHCPKCHLPPASRPTARCQQMPRAPLTRAVGVQVPSSARLGGPGLTGPLWSRAGVRGSADLPSSGSRGG